MHYPKTDPQMHPVLKQLRVAIQASMPQLPAEFRRQYRELGLPAADVLVLADELPTARYFDAVLAAGAPAKPAANWIMGDIMAFCKASLSPFQPSELRPEAFRGSARANRDEQCKRYI